MTTKFNPKQHRGKDRIFRPVAGATLLCRILKWDAEKSEYRDPPRGASYLARRYNTENGRNVLRAQAFPSLDEAKKWQARIGEAPETQVPQVELAVDGLPAAKSTLSLEAGPTFRDVYEEWKKRNFSRMAAGTQANYEKYLRLHFACVLDIPIRAITPKFIDEWLDDRKANINQFKKEGRRKCFLHELSLFNVVLKYYREYHDDPTFAMPMKQRHREAAIVGRKFKDNAQKDLTVDEFIRFRQALLQMNTQNAMTLAAMATVQYFQALRISEAAALHWEDILIDWRQPRNSRLRIHWHVIYLRQKNAKSYIEEGFKNASREDSVKEQPMFPESFGALKQIFRLHATGLTFKNSDGTFFDYRQIQSHYDRAFRLAGLPYRGTHVLRHGGTRNIYNETGDLAIAQQLLGNADLGSTLIYAKRHKSALTKVSDAHWERLSIREVSVAQWHLTDPVTSNRRSEQRLSNQFSTAGDGK